MGPLWLIYTVVALIAAGIAWFIRGLVDQFLELDSTPGCGWTEDWLETPDSLQKVQGPSIFAPPTKYISIVFPAYNEQARLGSTIKETLSYLSTRAKTDPNFTYEIIVVDDGSKDATVNVAFEHVRQVGFETVRVVRLRRNQGKGAAVRRGMITARGHLLLMADSDSATNIADLDKLESAVKESALRGTATVGSASVSREDPDAIGSKLGVAVGSRAHLEKDAIAKRKWYRNFLMHGFHLLVLVVAGGAVRDTQCGFKLFTRNAARQLFPNQRLRRWCFDVELISLCRTLRIPIREVPVRWTEIAGSKLSPTSILLMLLEMAYISIGYGAGLWQIQTYP